MLISSAVISSVVCPGSLPATYLMQRVLPVLGAPWKSKPFCVDRPIARNAGRSEAQHVSLEREERGIRENHFFALDRFEIVNSNTSRMAGARPTARGISRTSRNPR